MSPPLQHLYEFGPFRLDTVERLLLRNGDRVALTPKVFETLVALVEHRGHLIEKDRLIELVWRDSFVEEANLTNNISTLRKALGEGESGHTYIETIPRIGYRFTAQVRELPRMVTELVVEKHSLTRIITEEDADNGNYIEVAPVSASLSGRSAKRGWTKGRTGIVLVSLCLLLTAGVLALYRPWRARDAGKLEAGAVNQPQLRSIAVLHFKTIGAGNDENEYLTFGMSEALITRLGSLRQIIVRPASAVRRYADAQGDAVAAAGREQGVDAVLDGSLQRDGERIRVNVQLVRVQDRAVLWSGQFDERLTDIFAVQDSVSRQVAEGLSIKLSGEERGRLQTRSPRNIEAYQSYLRGRYFWGKRTIEGYEKAFEHFNRALDLDPAYAQAYAGLADAMLYRRINAATQQESQEALAKGRAALRKALEIDETLAEPHATLGLLAMNVDWDWPEAEKEFKRAIELNPNYATAHQWYGEFLAYMGRFDEAVAEIKRAQEVDPLSLIIATDVAKVYALARRYDEAITQYQRVLEMDPNFAEAHALLGMALSVKGRHEEAIAELHKIEGLENHQVYLSFLGYVYGQAGKKDEGRKALGQLENLSRRTKVSPFWMALINTGLGDKEQVFAWFERAFVERADSGALTLKVNPIFDSLRADPQFADLLRRAGFAQ